MAKTAGLGDQFYIAGYDLSGDISSVDQIGGGPNAGDVTAINKSAHERIGLLRDGNMAVTTWFEFGGSGNPVFEHDFFSTLPTADVIGMYFNGQAVGNAAAAINAKQANYDPTRDNSGNLSSKVSLLANGFGLEWGLQQTAGLRTDTAATNGASIDNGASSAFGGQAYLVVTAFSGTDVTIKLRHSTDNSTFADLISFTQITAAHKQERLSVSNSTTVNRYTRVETSTSAGFTSVSFAVVFVRNATAVVF
jgi:hypothetical protein